jgi:hypothetical protein
MGRRIDEMSDEELISIARQLHDVIYNVECYGGSDLFNYVAAIEELVRRGYRVKEVQRGRRSELVIKKTAFSPF